jgi:hypothetical protein
MLWITASQGNTAWMLASWQHGVGVGFLATRRGCWLLGNTAWVLAIGQHGVGVGFATLLCALSCAVTWSLANVQHAWVLAQKGKESVV